MRIEGVDPDAAVPPDARLALPSTPADAARFAEALRAQLRAAQAEALGLGLSDRPERASPTGRGTLTALIDELQRGLLGLRPGDGQPAGYPGFERPPRVGGSRQAAAGDPDGWRAMARSIGDRVVGQGFRAIFERQIDQESGFSPDVVYGRRLSSAGAEGIAQLMPQYYPNVNRLDPLQSLTVAATTMADYLRRYDGDVRKALAAYNVGPGRVGQLVGALGAGWEHGLPAETQGYLRSILGAAQPRLTGAVAGGSRAALRRPVDGMLTTDYGDGHRALDIGADSGAPIHAAATGRVVSVQKLDTGYGWHVIVDHGGGLQTLYAHASAIYVRPGDTVRQGDVIAAIGSTGRSTGPHLHFEVRRDGAPVDPRPYLA